MLTTLQQALPPGAPRDAGLGLFFASSVLIGAADVFATSQVLHIAVGETSNSLATLVCNGVQTFDCLFFLLAKEVRFWW